jgi:NitT/TauT family transport system substrate-binding protein
VRFNFPIFKIAIYDRARYGKSKEIVMCKSKITACTCTLAGFLCLIVLLSACGKPATPASPLTPITVQLNWTHQAQYAGMYAAVQKGYYTAEGLDVTFVEGGSNVDKLAPVINGAMQFGVAGADELILARSQGTPLRAIATLYRRSPVVFISLAEKGITQPQDFVGKTIRAPANTVPSLRAMTTHVGLAPDQYTVVDLPSDVALFASGDVPVWGLYSTGLAINIQQAGYKINSIYPDDYGVHFYADTLYATDDLITTSPDMVLRFLRATLEGWSYAIENPAETAAMVLAYNPQADIALEKEKLIAIVPLVNTGEDNIGWMKSEVWEGMAQTLFEQGILTQALDVSQVYTLKFLEEIYGQ